MLDDWIYQLHLDDSFSYEYMCSSSLDIYIYSDCRMRNGMLDYIALAVF